MLDGNSNNFQLLSSNTVNEMATPQIPSIRNDVGLHLFLYDTTNNLWGHDGSETGVTTLVGFNNSTKTGAILFTNLQDVDLDNMLVEAYKLGLKL